MNDIKKQDKPFKRFRVAVEYRGTIDVEVPIGVPYDKEMAEAIALSRAITKLDVNESAQDSAMLEFYEEKIAEEYPEWTETDAEKVWDKSEVELPDGIWEVISSDLV